MTEPSQQESEQQLEQEKQKLEQAHQMEEIRDALNNFSDYWHALMGDEDPIVVLRTVDINDIQKQLKRSYHAKSLTCHPDKTVKLVGDEKVQQEAKFSMIGSALRGLTSFMPYAKENQRECIPLIQEKMRERQVTTPSAPSPSSEHHQASPRSSSSSDSNTSSSSSSARSSASSTSSNSSNDARPSPRSSDEAGPKPARTSPAPPSYTPPTLRRVRPRNPPAHASRPTTPPPNAATTEPPASAEMKQEFNNFIQIERTKSGFKKNKGRQDAISALETAVNTNRQMTKTDMTAALRTYVDQHGKVENTVRSFFISQNNTARRAENLIARLDGMATDTSRKPNNRG